METEEFNNLVARLQIESIENPRRYRVRVLAFALLGYVYIFSILLLLLASLALLILMVVKGSGWFFAVKFGWAVLLLLFVTARALWVRIPAPIGIRLRRNEHPTLFSLIEETRTALGAPRPDVVLLVPDCNAAIAQVPRLGILGWQKNYLLLGLPLLDLFPTEEFTAILAHEFGHLSGSHSRFSAWIYRLRTSWGRILDELQSNEQWGAFLFQRFARWYAPHFNAYSFVLARAQEYEADESAARVAGTRCAADALVRVELAAQRVEEQFWPDIYRRARSVDEPPSNVYDALAVDGRLSPQPAEESSLKQCLARSTNNEDTHPCLEDRLVALATEPRTPQEFGRSAAEELLGDAVSLRSSFNEEWRTAVESTWKAAHQTAVEQRARLTELETEREDGSLSLKDEWERTCLLSAEEENTRATAALEAIVNENPEFAPGLRAWGRVLLERDDDRGLYYIDRALEASQEETLETCELAYSYLTKQDREEEAERYVRRAEQFQALVEEASRERASFDSTDEIDPHGLEERDLDAIRRQLREFDTVSSAYLVRMRVQHLPEYPAYVLGVELELHRGQNKGSLASKVRDQLAEALQFPGDWFCIVLNVVSRGERERIIELAGTPFYSAKENSSQATAG